MIFKKIFEISRLWKKILGVLFIVGMSSFLFSGTTGIVDEAHAQNDTNANTTQTNTTPSTSSLIDKTQVVGLVDLVLKVVYILLRPLLVIAGWSLDNTLVYGTVLHMDAPLRAFRNIMKNFANFALGFLVLFAIIRSIFNFGGKGDDKRKPQTIITQTLIAGVLIQISRFVMAALVDLSTVATYAVGALPLNIISSTPLGSHKIMNAHVEMDLSKFQTDVQGNEYFKVWYSVPYKKPGAATATSVNLSECETSADGGYVIGRMDGGSGFKNDGVFGGTKNACVQGGQVVFFNEFPDTYAQNDNAIYQANLKAILEQNSRDAWEKCNFVIKISGTPVAGDCSAALDKAKTDLDQIYTDAGQEAYSTNRDRVDSTKTTQIGDYGFAYGDTRLQNNPDALSLDSIVDKSKGFVGPLITMYSSMLDFSQLANTNNDTSFGEIGTATLIKTGFAIGLFFPLLALALVLIIRIGFMRAVIVGAPFLVLIKAFKREDQLPESLKKHFTLANVIQVIFAPVVTVFALSISLVFMSALMASIKTGGVAGFGMTKLVDSVAGSQGWSFFKDCLQLKLDGFEGLGGALDVFSWFLLNMVGIGLMRGIVFAAIELNSIGKGIGQKVQSFRSNFFQTLPILPIGKGGEGVGIGSLGNVVWNMPEKATEVQRNIGIARVEKFLGPNENKEGLGIKKADKFITNVAKYTTIDSAAIAKEASSITTKEGTEALEIIQKSLPDIFTVIEDVTDEKKTSIIQGLEDYTHKPNWYATYKLDNLIGDKTTGADAKNAIENMTPTADDIARFDALVTAGYRKSYTDAGVTTTYTLAKDNAHTGKYFFNGTTTPNPG